MGRNFQTCPRNYRTCKSLLKRIKVHSGLKVIDTHLRPPSDDSRGSEAMGKVDLGLSSLGRVAKARA